MPGEPHSRRPERGLDQWRPFDKLRVTTLLQIGGGCCDGFGHVVGLFEGAVAVRCVDARLQERFGELVGVC